MGITHWTDSGLFLPGGIVPHRVHFDFGHFWPILLALALGTVMSWQRMPEEPLGWEGLFH